MPSNQRHSCLYQKLSITVSPSNILSRSRPSPVSSHKPRRFVDVVINLELLHMEYRRTLKSGLSITTNINDKNQNKKQGVSSVCWCNFPPLTFFSSFVALFPKRLGPVIAWIEARANRWGLTGNGLLNVPPSPIVKKEDLTRQPCTFFFFRVEVGETSLKWGGGVREYM